MKQGCSAHVQVERSPELTGTVHLEGAKNSVLVSMAAVLLAPGISTLRRVPPSADIFQMIAIIEMLGAQVTFALESRTLTIDTTKLNPDLMTGFEKMATFRASTLILGPLLARCGRGTIVFPGGDNIGARPIDYHLRAFERMGASISFSHGKIHAQARQLTAQSFILEYPSVGTTENILMAAALIPGTTVLKNAALEPEIYDLIEILRKMGAEVICTAPATITITGLSQLQPVDHEIMYDRIEAGTFLVAAAMTGGKIIIPQAPVSHMELFLTLLSDMGHSINLSPEGLELVATKEPKSVSFRTMPYPGFPTDLQPPLLVAQTVAHGTSTVWETVYEWRLGHVRELQRMGAHITLQGEMLAVIRGACELRGCTVVAGDIRAGAALLLAGLVAQGTTTLYGVHHLNRGYVNFLEKLQKLGAKVELVSEAAQGTVVAQPITT